MRKISIRHNAAGPEPSSQGVGITQTARMKMQRLDQSAAFMDKPELNDYIAEKFLRAEPYHRYKLRSGEIGEFRRDGGMIFLAKTSGRGTADAAYVVITIQDAMKDVPEPLRKRRLSPGWGFE